MTGWKKSYCSSSNKLMFSHSLPFLCSKSNIKILSLFVRVDLQASQGKSVGNFELWLR